MFQILQINYKQAITFDSAWIQKVMTYLTIDKIGSIVILQSKSRTMGNQCCQSDNTISFEGQYTSAMNLTKKEPLAKKQKQSEIDRQTAKQATDDQAHKNLESGESREYSKTQSTNRQKTKGPFRKSTPIDMKDGFHKFTFPDGNHYEGEWKNNLQHGMGKLTYKNNDYYEGEWENGKPSGYGVYVSTTGYRYKGGWLNGDYHGEGVEDYDNGVHFKGNFSKGKKNGFGKFCKAQDQFYQGEFKDDKFHGKGKYVWPGQIYDGQWQESEMHGYGQSTWNDGRRYSGLYAHGKKHGYGEFYWPDNRCYKGEWRNGNWTNGVYVGANGVVKKISKQDQRKKQKKMEVLSNSSEVNSIHL